MTTATAMAKPHSHGPNEEGGHASRADRPVSFDLEAIPVPRGREEDWRFTPIRRIDRLFDPASYAEGDAPVTVEAPEGVIVEKAGRGDERLGTVLAPGDRTAVVAWNTFTESTVITVPKGSVLAEPIRLNVDAIEGTRPQHIRVEVGELDSLEGESFDDIVFFGADPEGIEKAALLLGTRGVMCTVLSGERIGRKLSLDIGRVHYDFTRFCGTTGSDPAEGYAWIPANGELRENDTCAFIGAAGPMGVMHTMRAVTSGVKGLSVVGTDLSDERLENLKKVVGPSAEKNGVPLEILNTSTQPLEYGYTYVTCLVPVPPLVSQAVDMCAEGAILNAFAGIPAGTFGDFELQGIIERKIFMLGTSGSDVSDMRTVLKKIEEGIIDTTISLWAVTGMAGFGDAIGSVITRTSGGKIMVFPMLHDLGLTPVSELAEKFPEVAAKLNDGLWTKEAEEALLASAK